MTGIEAQVFDTFLERLRASGEVSDAVKEALHEYLRAGRLPSAEQLADLFTKASGDALA